MSDLVKRLRELETKLPTSSDNWIEARELQLEAAARIEALEAALKPFADAWNVCAKHHNRDALFRNLSIGQLGRLAAGETAGVHFRNAASLLEPKT